MIKNFLLSILIALAVTGPAQAGVVGKEITYRAGELEMKGYIAYDETLTAKRPGVIVVHEWWGHNAYVRKRAELLAAAGYVAMAVDMYGNGRQATHPDEAGKFAAEVRNNLPEARKRFLTALEVLKADPMTDPGKLAAIGYCFGGGVALQMARDGVELKGVVSFHGSLESSEPAKPGKIKAEILVFNGGADQLVSPESIHAFVKEMTSAEADFTFHSLPGAKHSFTNPDANRLAAEFKMPLAYQEKGDKESWRDTLSFFNRIFSE
ncbi:MAG TPA: dienelactone hydrolase family protein [Desulfurivibrionaceae bacterium]|nr:dienelactone hydrolase family protein [Desulfurivibrionaceae bacterium]